jgi:hypothetical protein
VQLKYAATMMVGDFNLNIEWSQGAPKPHGPLAESFLAAFHDMFFEQFVNEPTRYSDTCESLLDLFLCDVPAIVISAEVLPGVSDHEAVLATLSVTLEPRKETRLPPKHNFRRANWPLLRELLEQRLPVVDCSSVDVEKAWTDWQSSLWECIDLCVPMGTGRYRASHPWVSKEAVKLIRQRDKAYKSWRSAERRLASAEEINERKVHFQSLKKKTTSTLTTAMDEYLHKLGQGPEGQKQMWKYIHSVSKSYSNECSFNVGGRLTSDPVEVADGFSDGFMGNFTSAQVGVASARRLAVDSVLDDFVITSDQVAKLLAAVRPNAATGPDGIPGVVLHECASALAPTLTEIFKVSVKLGFLPVDWKSAHVIPIYKNGDKKDLGNYRPISITSLVGKILEKVVCSALLVHCLTAKIIPDNQHGFLPGRSCTTMLMSVVDKWLSWLDRHQGAHVHTIILDWKKAFDRVPHERLISKLQNAGVRGRALAWISDFLRGRTQRVVFRGSRSSRVLVESGVVQGSCLGPLLFNIFMADLPACLSSDVVQYADDSTLFRLITSPADAEALQSDLVTLGAWCKNNGMELNLGKCKSMDITFSDPLQHPYTIDGVVLPYCKSEKLLGVTISSDLKWNAHVDAVRAKGARTLGFVSRMMRGCSSRVRRTAYLALVRPVLLYGTPAWHPTTQENLLKLERLHRKGLRFVYGAVLPAPSASKILPLSSHLQFNDMNYVSGALSGKVRSDVLSEVVTGRVIRGQGDVRRLIPPHARTTARQCGFVYRAVSSWNELPGWLKSAPPDKFKGHYKTYLLADTS